MTSKFFLSMYDKFKTIIRYSFCDIQNNQGLVKVYQPRPSASADNLLFNLDFFWISQKPNLIIVNYWITLALDFHQVIKNVQLIQP